MKNLIRFDWAVKRLLRNKANFVILEGFLSELLGEDIFIQEILESESNKENKYAKFNRVDLLVKNLKGELIIIEVQNDKEHDYLLRILFGTSKLLIENISEGMQYSQIKKIYSVNIVYFDLGQGDDYIYHGTTNFVGLNKKDVLKLTPKQEEIYHTEIVSKLYPEYYVIKVNRFDDIAKNTLDEWIYFLKNEEIKDSFKAKGLNEAREQLSVLKLSDTERKEYDYYIEQQRYESSLIVSNFIDGRLEGIEEGKLEGKLEGRLEGRLEGKLEGKLEEKLEIAINCLKENIPIETVVKLTGLTKEEIEKLI